MGWREPQNLVRKYLGSCTPQRKDLQCQKMMEMTCHLNLWKSTKWIKNKRDDKPFSSCEMMILFFDKFNSSDFLSLKKPSASMFFSLSIPPQLSFYLSVSRPSALCAAYQLPF